jgi:hypothetical protein
MTTPYFSSSIPHSQTYRKQRSPDNHCGVEQPPRLRCRMTHVVTDDASKKEAQAQ